MSNNKAVLTQCLERCKNSLNVFLENNDDDWNLLLDLWEDIDESADDEEDEDQEERPRRRRRSYVRKDPYKSAWYALLKDPTTADPNSRLGKRFRLRFWVPLARFLKISDIFIRKGWLQVRPTNIRGRPSIPFQLKLMAVFRFIGRGESFDTIAELTGDLISCEVLRVCMLNFFNKMASLKDDYISVDHVTSTKAYALLGNPGALGSMDAVNIPWDKCPSTWQYVSLIYMLVIDVG